jgi:REP element-mobilizing transposase RayT
MNPKLKRYHGAGDLHFITCSCYRRQPLLETGARRDLFLAVLEQVRRRYQFVVAGYVVMPEHIHLLIGEPQVKTPSTVMQALKIGFARRVLAQGRLFGPSSAAHLAEALLRFRRLDRTQTHRETSVYASQSGETWIGGVSRPLALE